MTEQGYLKDSIFRIGEIYAVNGREITIKVDKNKNLSHILYQGQLVKNVSVGSYLKIQKGFDRLVAKVEGELLKENHTNENYHSKNDQLSRFLIVKIIGYFDGLMYHKGVKEIPLIGNICYLLDNEEFTSIHRFATPDEIAINLGHVLSDGNIPVEISMDKLFASHIGIFGNTGSGKSHTLAKLYQELFAQMSQYNNFKKHARFVVFDFNGEYSGSKTITPFKKVYNLDTRSKNGDKLPFSNADLLKPELLSILCSASEKTQQPFLKRALILLDKIEHAGNPQAYLRAILHKLVEDALVMSDRIKAKLLLDYFEQILIAEDDINGRKAPFQKELNWHGQHCCFYFTYGDSKKYFNNEADYPFRKQTLLYKEASEYKLPEKSLEKITHVLYIQLIEDILSNRAMNEHIFPVINKLKGFTRDFERVFEFSNKDIWQDHNLIVINLNRANISVKKMIPMLLSYKLYEEKKALDNNKTSLNIIIDEAHNILSYESLRESESFKDFRLETFEEIIKEGRKFGVFLTLSSQRPSDISPTIISQLHNYLIHRLVNNKDIEMIEKAVAYLDKISLESLPILPVGACILSGLIADLPIILQVSELPLSLQPNSQTIKLSESWIDKKNAVEMRKDDADNDMNNEL